MEAQQLVMKYMIQQPSSIILGKTTCENPTRESNIPNGGEGGPNNNLHSQFEVDLVYFSNASPNG